MRRRGRAQPVQESKRRRGAPSSADSQPDEVERPSCPVCMEAFETTGLGARTIVHAFACNGGDGIRHAICRSCDRRMFNGHGDTCPICRAPRLGSSIAELGWRPPSQSEDAFAPMFGPMVTTGGTIFFPVADDDPGIPIVEIRRVGASSNSETNDAGASTIIRDVLSDPMVMAAIEGLRNPGNVTIGTFLSNVGEARRARDMSRVPTRMHREARAMAEPSSGDM